MYNSSKFIRISLLLKSYSSSAPHLLKEYSLDEQTKILKILKKCAQENVCRYHLNEKRITGLQNFLKTNNEFSNLEEVLQINGIGFQTLNKICKSILEDDEPVKEKVEEPKLRSVSGLLTPPLECHKKVESVVGINITFNAVSWATIHCLNREVTAWSVYDFSETVGQRCEMHTLYQTVTEIHSLIPKADVYVMENNNWTNVSNIKVSPALHIQRSLKTAMLLMLLNARDQSYSTNNSSNKNQVYFLKNYTPARLFKTLIGLERVSAQTIVDDIYFKNPDERYQEVSISDELYENYKLSDGHLKENMSQSLLLTISFMELVLSKNSNAMRVLVERSNKKRSSE